MSSSHQISTVIPHDIVIEILSRLPVRSVTRFKAVSKLWRSTISNPSFKRRSPPTSLFAISLSSSDSSGDEYGSKFHLIDENGGIKEFPVPVEDSETGIALSNSCNGMLLLLLGADIFLVNLSTRYIDRVLTVDKWYVDKDYGIGMGFCYDESIDDYKALMFLSHLTFGKSVIVASLTQKQWLRLRVPIDFPGMSTGPLVNDRFHSAVRICLEGDHFGVSNAIISYNPIKDIFENVACPKPKSGDENAIVSLGVLEDCLCMVRMIGEDMHRGDVEVLKMKEYGVAKSWTILFVFKGFEVDRHFSRMEPLLLTNNGDILFRSRDNIWRYNLAENSYSEFIQSGDIKWIDAIPFVENLIPPNILPVSKQDDCEDNGENENSVAGFFARIFFETFPQYSDSYRIFDDGDKSPDVSKNRGDGYRRNIGVCFNCGEAGHMARDCFNIRRSSGGGCYNCGKQGHLARDCARGSGGRRARSERRGSGSACYNCGKPGHFARDCEY